MNKPRANVAASVRARLLQLRAVTGEDYNQLLVRYCIERLLYRLSVSEHRERFILKGAMLFVLWKGSPHRQTRDVDFLGYGSAEPAVVAETFRNLCKQPVVDDGVVFEPESVAVEGIRAGQDYEGVRVTFRAFIGVAKVVLQVDVGFGDIITPAPETLMYPGLLNLPRAELRCYPKETVIAEKVEAILNLDLRNTRYKDYYDIAFLAEHFDFDGETLRAAIEATIGRRGSRDLLSENPPGLSPQFSTDPEHLKRWDSFCRKSGFTPQMSLQEVVSRVAALVAAPLGAICSKQGFAQTWRATLGQYEPR